MATAMQVSDLHLGQQRWIYPKRILVATDLDDLDHVFPIAVEEAKQFGAELLLIHVLPDFVSPSMAPSLLVYSQPDLHRQYAHAQLSSAAKSASEEGIDCGYRIVSGKVTDTIASIVDEWRPDRIIVGSHGKSKYSLRILGSNSEKLFRQLSLPVLAVGPRVPVHRQQIGRPVRILLPISMKRNARYLFRLAADLQANEDFDVTVLHVIDKQRVPAATASRIRHCEDILLKYLREAGSKQPRIEVRTGDITETVLRTAEDGHFDMVLLGNNSASAFVPEAALSSAYSVLCEAPCPVLVVKGPQERLYP